MITTRRHAADVLLKLEAEERRLCARMNRDRVRRNIIQGEITKLRCGLSDAEAERYRRRRLLARIEYLEGLLGEVKVG